MQTPRHVWSLAAPLGELAMVALLVDGVHFGEHLCVVALGVGIDGGKALRAAVPRVFDHPVIGRCQLHKVRNSAILAEAQLEDLHRTHPLWPREELAVRHHGAARHRTQKP